MININKMFTLTLGQGHNVKCQGQICNYVEKLFRLYIMSQYMDLIAIGENKRYILMIDIMEDNDEY